MMKSIFPGYVEIVAPADDDARAKWLVVRSKMDEDAMLRLPLVGVSGWSDVADVNLRVNMEIQYRLDPDDRWQSPAETMTLSSGDCEDFAILKWALLWTSGKFTITDMALVLGEIASLAGNQPHAFLVVRWDGELRVLDNKFDQLIDPRDYINWQPKKVITEGDVFLYDKPFTIADVAKRPPA